METNKLFPRLIMVIMANIHHNEYVNEQVNTNEIRTTDQELTSSAGEDVVLGMNTFVRRLLAVSDPSQ